MKHIVQIVAGLLLTAPAARAQDDIGMSMFNSANQMAVSLSLTQLNNDAVLASTHGTAARSGTTAAAGKATRTSFAYVPTAALQKQTADAYVAQVRAASTPAAAQTVAEALAGKTNYPALYRELNSGTGLRENDAADVMALYLLENWIIANKVTDASVITAAKTQAVRAQAAHIMANNSKLSSAAALAQLGEQLKLNTAMLEVGRLRAQHDGNSTAYSQKVARQFNSRFHFDLSALQLTSQGLVKK